MGAGWRPEGLLPVSGGGAAAGDHSVLAVGAAALLLRGALTGGGSLVVGIATVVGRVAVEHKEPPFQIWTESCVYSEMSR